MKLKYLIAVLTAATAVTGYADECWRRTPNANWNNCPIYDYHWEELKGIDVSGARVHNANFEGAHLEGTNMSKFEGKPKHMGNAHLQGANLSGTASRKPDLSGQIFKKSAISYIGTNFSYTNLSRAEFWKYTDLTGAHLEGNNFSGANLDGTWFDRTFLQRANLSNFEGKPKIGWAYLQGANLSGTKFRRTDLSGQGFHTHFYNGTDFSYTNLSKSEFVKWSNLVGANFEGANLEGTKFDRANLSGANFTDVPNMNLVMHIEYAYLNSTNFTNTNLSKRNFSGKDLANAIFTKANLTEANFTGANLVGATFTNAILTRVNFSGATWIDGKKCQNGSIGYCRI